MTTTDYTDTYYYAGTTTDCDVYRESSTGTTTVSVWDAWNTNGTVTSWIVNNDGVWSIEYESPVMAEVPTVAYPQETEEERAERERQRQQMEREANERLKREKEEREAAEERGDQLLHEIIGDVLYHQYKEQGYVDIPSNEDNDLRYRIRSRRNVQFIRRKKDKWVEDKTQSLCIHLGQCGYVDADNVLALVLYLWHDEKEFKKVANLHRYAA